MSNDFSKPMVLECPACGASLALPDADTFQCDYCGKSILVPPELRPHNTPQVASCPPESLLRQALSAREMVNLDGKGDRVTGSKQNTAGLIIIASLGVLLIGSLVTFLLLLPRYVSPGVSEIPDVQLDITPLPTMVQFARLAMVFGSKGDQPGQFDDARSIAVDDQGNIFVADYSSGRINKFDSQGNFLQLIQVESFSDNPDIYIFDISADSHGNLYVAADGNILKYQAETGALLATFQDQWPEIYYDSVVVAPNGNLFSTNGMAGADDVLILNPEGEMLAHWTETIKSIDHDDPAVELALAVNPTGRVFILSFLAHKVYAFDRDGSFSFSFGEEGNRAGQLSLSTGMLAITSQGYLVISDVYRVDLFDEAGNYLNKTFTIDYQVAEGSMYGMTIDAQGNLYYISSGGKVLKFSMNYP